MRENPYNEVMSIVQTLAKTTLQGGRQMLRFTGVSQEQLRKTEGVLIPIAPLGVEHFWHTAHLLNLADLPHWKSPVQVQKLRLP